MPYHGLINAFEDNYDKACQGVFNSNNAWKLNVTGVNVQKQTDFSNGHLAFYLLVIRSWEDDFCLMENEDFFSRITFIA